MARMSSTALPVLSIADAERRGSAFDDQLRRASSETGFFYLVDHGIPATLQRELLVQARRFFALPDDDKLAVEMLRSPHFRGYTRLGGELTRGRQDWREQIDIGAERAAIDPAHRRNDWDVLEGPNQWPLALPSLRQVLDHWDHAMRTVAMRLLHAWARALAQQPDVFDAAFADRPATLLKVVRYVGRPGGAADQGVGAHKDPGVLTLLWIEDGGVGLQVDVAGEWVDVPPLPGALVVNIGELLEIATGGYLVATTHRVVSPPAGSERISVPYFFNPALDSRFPQLVLPAELAARARGVTADPANIITDTFGANMLKARLRAHPDVAQRHHPDLVAARAGA